MVFGKGAPSEPCLATILVSGGSNRPDSIMTGYPVSWVTLQFIPLTNDGEALALPIGLPSLERQRREVLLSECPQLA